LQGNQLAADSEAVGPSRLAPAADKAVAAAETVAVVDIEVAAAAADVDIAAVVVVVVLEPQLRDSSC